MRKGFTLIEVIVATGLLLLVGTALTALLARSENAARSSEAAEAATLFIRTMALQAQNAPPDWLPNGEGATVALTRAQIASILNQMPRRTFSSPDLYEAWVTRESSTAQGLSNFTAKVCVRSTTGPVCVTTDLFLAASSVHVPPPQGTPVAPPSGRAVVLLSITGPEGGTANVSLAGQTYTRFGLYTQEVSPGTVTLTAEETASDRYTYTASPRRESATVSAGTSRSFSVTYTCATGAAAFTVIPPPGMENLPQGTVTLEPGRTDISRSGLVPYLAPQRYTVNARDVRSRGYTYSARVSPASDFAVTPCQTQNVTVTYAPASTDPPPETGGNRWGTIIITVKGLPNAGAAVSVTGRFTNGSHAMQSFLFGNGTYTVTALGGRVLERGWYYVGGEPYEHRTPSTWWCRLVYEATVSPAQFFLEAGSTAHVTVTYRLTRRVGECPP